MVFVFSGKGFWIFGSLVIAFLIAAWLERLIEPGANRIWPICAALIASGLVCIGMGVHALLSPERFVIERQTGRERMVRPVHSAYWLRAEYWGVLYLCLAGWLAVLHVA